LRQTILTIASILAANANYPLWHGFMILHFLADLSCLSAISPDEATVSRTGTLMDVLERLIMGLS
jgi:hypothetical protein